MDVLVVLLAVLVAAALGVGLLATGVARSRRRANEVVPGVPTTAPVAWAGAHTPEAKLHRRLRDAVRSLRAQGDSPAVVEHRTALEQAAVDLDAHLVAVAALPSRVRDEPLARVAAAVAALEETAAAVALRGGDPLAASAGAAVVDEVAERLRLLDAARAELDAAVPDVTAAGTPVPPPRVRPADELPPQPRPGT